jgi:HSP20 family molecular chaperone IbpA
MALPTAVVADKADARSKHGVLTLRLPKAEEIKPKPITVRAR